MIKNSLLFIFLFVTGCLLASDDIPLNPFKAPLYWDVYENHITKPADVENYISEADWEANINWVDQNLKSYGYNMICIDGWGDVDANEYGYRTKHSHHWLHTYAWWAAELAKKGMTLGIYDNPLWISKAHAGTRKIKGTNIPIASLIDDSEWSLFGFTWVQVDRPGAEEYVKGYIQHYADMGVRYLRVDFLSWYETGTDKNEIVGRTDRPKEHYETALRWMREECDKHGMFLSLVMPHLKNDAEIELKYGHMVRIDEDVNEGGWGRFSEFGRGEKRDDWSQLSNPFDGFIYWSKVSGRNKMILDGDFIRINTFANDEERKSVVSLHLMAGGPISVADQHNTIGGSLWIYQNTELLALNADGFVGQPLSNSLTNYDKNQVWKGQMSNGDWIVGLFNRYNSYKTRSINFSSELGMSSGYVRDLWEHANQGSMSSLSVSLPPHGCKIYRISLSPYTGNVLDTPVDDVSFYSIGNNRFIAEHAENGKITVVDILGNQVYTDNSTSNNEIINLQMLSKGIYITHIQKGEKYKTIKCYIK
jgi:hypothetical protein